jgi:hypothetical protein
MSLDDHMQTAFHRGTGVSREYALRSKRVRELTQETVRNPQITPTDFAEMTYLGERLADAAFKAIPRYYRREALKWADMEQYDHKILLTMLSYELNSAEWKRRARRLDAHLPYSSFESVLPGVYRSWRRGPVQPNCLGVTQMLIGFARKTGAKHLMVNVLERVDERKLVEIHKSLTLIKDELFAGHQHIPAVRRLGRSIARYDREVLDTLGRIYDKHGAHHALLIQTRDGSWQLLDPYLMSHIPTIENESADSELNVTDAYDYIAKEHGGAVYFCDRESNKAPLLFLAVVMLKRVIEMEKGAVEEMETLLAGFKNTLVRDEAAMLHDKQEDYVWFGRRKAKELENEDRAVVHELRERAIARTRVNTQLRLRAHSRLIQYVFELVIKLLYSEAEPYLPPTVELVNPSYHLGVATVHHVGSSQQQMQPDIIRYTKSQFVLRDVLFGSPLKELIPFGPSLKLALEMIDDLGSNMVLPEIKLYLEQQRKETPHDETPLS